jgi:vacuolar-type H+-ATPase subunit E/Vma4
MIPIEVKRIIEVVEKDSRKKAGEIRKANILEVKKILREGKDEYKKLRARILEDYGRRAEALKRKGLADIEIKKRESLKDVKSDMVKTLKEDVVKTVREEDYERFLAGLLERGIREMGKRKLEVFVDRRDVVYAKNFLRKKRVEGKVKTIKTSGGCMIKSGKMTANYLIESIMERKEREMDKIINDMFFRG